jgi:serine/threonine protein phosphatase 1
LKYFVVSDIHGHFYELIKALHGKYDEYNPNHKLIVAGDLFDRGTQNVEVFNYLYRLKNEGKAIIIKGNHDSFFDDLINENYDGVLWNISHNGFSKTLTSFAPNCDYFKDIKESIETNYPHLIIFLRGLPYYYETKNYIITHAGLDFSNGDWHDGNWKHAIWTRTEEFFEIDLKKQYNIDKQVIVGHRFAYKLRKAFKGEESYSTYIHDDGQKIAIDGGVVLSKQINVYKFEDECEG